MDENMICVIVIITVVYLFIGGVSTGIADDVSTSIIDTKKEAAIVLFWPILLILLVIKALLLAIFGLFDIIDDIFHITTDIKEDEEKYEGKNGEEINE